MICNLILALLRSLFSDSLPNFTQFELAHILNMTSICRATAASGLQHVVKRSHVIDLVELVVILIKFDLILLVIFLLWHFDCFKWEWYLLVDLFVLKIVLFIYL